MNRAQTKINSKKIKLDRYLFFLGTPHQVHFFKNIIFHLEERGHKVKIIGRDKDCELELLKEYFENYDLVEFNEGIFGKIFGMFKTDYEVYKIVKEFQPDIMLGSVPINLAHVGKILGIPVIAFNDTEHATAIINLSIPFCDFVLTSTSYTKDHGKNHIRYNGFHELAYLHPDYFKPNSTVLEKLGVKRSENFAIIRLISSTASHDTNSSNLSLDSVIKVVKFLANKCRIFITSERELPDDLKKYIIKIHPADLHSALYYSNLCISDGSTTAVEAALLGTPTLHYEKYITKEGVIGAKELLGYLNELSSNYNLFYTYSSEKEFIDRIKEFYNCTKYQNEFINNSKRVFLDKEDVTKVILKIINKCSIQH